MSGIGILSSSGTSGLCPGLTNHDSARVEQGETCALHVLLRLRCRLSRDDRKLAALTRGIDEARAEQCRLHATPAVIRQRSGAAQLGETVNDAERGATGECPVS